jgi:hypothetical protein
MADNDQKRQSAEKNTRNEDIHDSERDIDRLKADKASLDLPDVKDIPGQEHVHVPPFGDMADTTISSDDEEGVGVFDDDVDDETVIQMGSENDIPKEDKVALETMDNLDVSRQDDEVLARQLPDNQDSEGEQLNERIDVSGSDLDTAIVDEDDRDEEIGAEDEENNSYSLGSDSEHEGGTRG